MMDGASLDGFVDLIVAVAVAVTKSSAVCAVFD